MHSSLKLPYMLRINFTKTLSEPNQSMTCSTYKCIYIAKQKQPGCKKSARPIRSHNGYKRPKTLISSKAKKLNILLRILLLE